MPYKILSMFRKEVMDFSINLGFISVQKKLNKMRVVENTKWNINDIKDKYIFASTEYLIKQGKTRRDAARISKKYIDNELNSIMSEISQ